MKIIYSLKNVAVFFLVAFGIVRGTADRNGKNRELNKKITFILKVTRVFPFRQEIHKTETERFYDKSGVCKEAGFKRNETDSSQFYR